MTPTDTLVARRSLLMEIPLGLNEQFLIHKVVQGDSLELLAGRYSTSVDAIHAVNYQMRSPVWLGDVIVIPLRPDELQDMPRFEPYMVLGESITVQDLAQQQNVDASLLAYYNALDMDYDLAPGDLVLIPR